MATIRGRGSRTFRGGNPQNTSGQLFTANFGSHAGSGAQGGFSGNNSNNDGMIDTYGMRGGGGGGGGMHSMRSVPTRSRRGGPGTAGQQRGGGGGGGGRGGRGGRGGSPYDSPNAQMQSSEDRDGDLPMGAVPNPGSRFTPYGRRNAPRTQQVSDEDLGMGDNGGGEAVRIMITGYNGIARDGFFEWLKRKSHSTFQPINISYENQVLYFEVPDQRIASAVCRVNGYTFRERTLTINRVGGDSTPPPPQTQQLSSAPGTRLSTIDTLRLFLQQRWQPETKYLNLDKVDPDPILKNAGIRGFGHSHGSHQFGPAVMKLAAELFGEIHSISFANNRLRNVLSISTVAQFLPNIQNISLKDNDIQAFVGLEALTGPGKLKGLRELELRGNPITDREISRSGDDVAYRSEITRRFPSLKVLDGKPVAPTIQFDIPEAEILSTKEVKLPATVKGPFFDSDHTRGAAMDFVGKYFAAFDNNRPALINLYDPNALFSVSLNTWVPPTARLATNRRWDQSKSDWSGWTAYSRNLTRIKDANRRFQTIHHGNVSILNVLTKLPQTSHDQEAPEKFCIDAWQLSGYEAAATGGQGVVLFVTVHGEFLEGPTRIARSFDRTFIVAPSAAGSIAQLSGSLYVILSDQLNVRTYVGHEAWQPQPEQTPVAATMPMMPAVLPVGISPIQIPQERMIGLSDHQHNLALELMRQTRLNYHYATQCLLDNGWDMNRGLEAFQRLRATNTIPPQAWID